MSKILKSFIFGLMLFQASLSEAEIIRATVRWNPISCDKFCVANLAGQFGKIPAVEAASINQAAGQVDLTYRRNAPFSFDSLNYALAALGLPVMDVRLRVRGIIQHNAQDVFLVSSGDGTRFTLLNPVVPDNSGQAAEFNFYARYLRPPLRQRLLEIESQGETAVIEGPLFMPERGFTLSLVVESLGSEKN